MCTRSRLTGTSELKVSDETEGLRESRQLFTELTVLKHFGTSFKVNFESFSCSWV